MSSQPFAAASAHQAGVYESKETRFALESIEVGCDETNWALVSIATLVRGGLPAQKRGDLHPRKGLGHSGVCNCGLPVRAALLVIHKRTDVRRALTLAALVTAPPWPIGRFRLQNHQSSMKFPLKPSSESQGVLAL